MTNQFTLTFIVKEREILRAFLTRKNISKRTLTAVKYEGGQLLVNGIERDVRYMLAPEDSVKVVFPPEELSEGLLAEDGELDIVYEDDAVLLLQKPAATSTIPSFSHRTGTIANFVAGKLLRENIPATVHVVTRLDYDTSGLLCIAKNRHIHHLLGKQIAESSFKRRYEAVVEGHLKQDEFLIDACIGRKEGSIIERMVRPDGQEAKTYVQVLKRFEKNGQQFTHVALTLQTGRTHQIRVHMCSIGHPLAGDDLYGGGRDMIGRQALHCTALSFQHPISGKKTSFINELSTDIKAIFPRK